MNGYRIERRNVEGSAPEWMANLPAPLARVYRARGITESHQLEFSLDRLPQPADFAGIAEAVALLAAAMNANQRILVVGDYDADGATSTALMVGVLRALGAATVDFLVPNRFRYGYGLTPEIVELAALQKPDLIITVDNGIASHDGVARANALGIRVLVTDHHLPGATLPAAAAILNPVLADDSFPARALAGVGVAFYLVSALRSRLREEGWFDRRGVVEPNLARWLDLVALGTVADVVPLDETNRVLVTQGVARIRAGRASPGVNALVDVAGRERGRLTSSDLGFAVGPRLNAAGRLDDMSLGIRCLLTDDRNEARRLAGRLDELNRQRQEIESTMREEAFAQLGERLDTVGGEPEPVLCLYDHNWHQGVIGIVASRVKERYHRPTVVFADGDEGELRGSARSIRGVHMRDLLERVANRHPGLIVRFGGHAMAAGLTLRAGDLAAFEAALRVAATEFIDPADLEPVIRSDGSLVASEVTLGLAEILRYALPWGQRLPPPRFDNEFVVESYRWLQEKHLKLQLLWPDGGRVDAIAFNFPAERWPAKVRRVRAVYQLDINRWRGEEKLQLLIDHLETVEGNRGDMS